MYKLGENALQWLILEQVDFPDGVYDIIPIDKSAVNTHRTQLAR